MDETSPSGSTRQALDAAKVKNEDYAMMKHFKEVNYDKQASVSALSVALLCQLVP